MVCLHYVEVVHLYLDLSLMLNNVECTSVELWILQIKDFDSVLFAIIRSCSMYGSGAAFTELLVESVLIKLHGVLCLFSF